MGGQKKGPWLEAFCVGCKDWLEINGGLSPIFSDFSRFMSHR